MTRDRLTFYRLAPGTDWRWRVQAGNNEITAASTEGYENRADAEANARRYLQLAATENPDEFLVLDSPSGDAA